MARTKKTVTFLDTPALPPLGAIRKKPTPKKKRLKRPPSKEKIAKTLASPKKENRKSHKSHSVFAGQRMKHPLEPKIIHHITATQKHHPATTPHNPTIPNHAHVTPQHQDHTQEHHQKKVPSFDPNKPIGHQLAENLVELQKVNIHLAEKFDKMEKQLSELLSLFEMAARSLAKKPENQTSQKDKEFLGKIDRLLEQNKTIAKGLTLMEDHVRSRIQDKPTPFHQEPEARQPLGRPLPRF